jgi:hypothetical protein
MKRIQALLRVDKDTGVIGQDPLLIPHKQFGGLETIDSKVLENSAERRASSTERTTKHNAQSPRPVLHLPRSQAHQSLQVEAQ